MYYPKSWVVCLSLLVLTGCRRLDTSPATSAFRPLHGTGRVYFVPVGNFPTPVTQQLVTFFHRKYGLTIKALPRLHPTAAVGNPLRGQISARQLLAQMRQANAKLYKDPTTLLIGLTDVDMYNEDKPDWRFEFADQQGSRLAVVSTARLDPVSYGGPADDALTQTRLQKMVSKKIGMMYYHLPKSDDRRSVMYRSILGDDDLDNMGEDF